MVQEESEPAQKDLQDSRDSAKKAVEKARDTQQKLSIEENARKAEEARQVGAVQRKGQGWLLGLLGVALVAVVVRGVLKRRG
jgi:CHASE3 domain sensor protein